MEYEREENDIAPEPQSISNLLFSYSNSYHPYNKGKPKYPHICHQNK